MKHGLETNLEDLDFEAINKEIEANKAAQASQTSAAVDEEPLAQEMGGNDDPAA